MIMSWFEYRNVQKIFMVKIYDIYKHINYQENDAQ